MEKDIPIEKIQIDVDLVHGQIRPIDQARVQEIALGLRIRPPAVACQVLVWDMAGMHSFSQFFSICFDSQTDGNYAVLGGQHLVSALKIAQTELVSGEKTVPPTISTVRARVLAHETPVKERQEEVYTQQQTKRPRAPCYFGQPQTAVLPFRRANTTVSRHVSGARCYQRSRDTAFAFGLKSTASQALLKSPASSSYLQSARQALTYLLPKPPNRRCVEGGPRAREGGRGASRARGGV